MYARPSLWSFSCLIVTLLSSLLLCGEANKPTPNEQPKGINAPAASTPAPPLNGTALKITLKPSREQALAGSFFGITATIENVSDRPVFLIANSFSLAVPPEIDPEGPRDWTGFLPGADPGINPNDPLYWEKYNDLVVVLPPKATIPAMWNQNFGRSDPQDINGSIKWFFRGLIFPPGRYTLTAVGSYWDTEEAAKKRSLESWHRQTADMQEPIGAPQSTLLFGAMLGGIFAFWLVWKADSSLYSGWGKGTGIGLLSAILLSIIVTILLARLSDTDFVIRTTVNDLWGAMAVGFIGTASGPTILRKFANALRGKQPIPEPPEHKEHQSPPEHAGRAPEVPALPVASGNGNHR